MDKFLGTLVGMALVAVVMFVGVLTVTVVGAFAGWVVGWFFSDTILGIFAKFGVHGFAMWQIGAFLGFVGGFFRVATEKETEKETETK